MKFSAFSAFFVVTVKKYYMLEYFPVVILARVENLIILLKIIYSLTVLRRAPLHYVL